MPSLCNEFTVSSVAPAMRCTQLPGTMLTLCALAVRACAFATTGVEWSKRPGRSCRRWCSVPPMATLNSWKPRQMASSGTPAATAARISGMVTPSRSGSSGMPSGCARP